MNNMLKIPIMNSEGVVYDCFECSEKDYQFLQMMDIWRTIEKQKLNFNVDGSSAPMKEIGHYKEYRVIKMRNPYQIRLQDLN